MGLFGKLFGAESSAEPRSDDFASLITEEVAYGGKRLSRKYWNSIYLGAYAPQLDMAVLKGKKLSTEDGRAIVQALHELIGEDSVGNTEWTDEDADDLEGLSLQRSWNIEQYGVEVSLDVDNFNTSDDPVMLTIQPWKSFGEFVRSKK